MLSWIRRIWNAFIAWWTGKKTRYSSFTGVAFVESTTDPASELRQRKLVIVGSPEKSKWLRFACPCQCGDEIALNLMPTHSPRWKIEFHDDETLSVHPSVDATKCGSHFWIRKSRIDWV